MPGGVSNLLKAMKKQSREENRALKKAEMRKTVSQTESQREMAVVTRNKPLKLEVAHPF